MKITAQTEAVSSPPEEKWHWSQQWRQNTFRAGQKLKADWKKDLHNLGAGRKSRKPPTPFVGMKPNGKSQVDSACAGGSAGAGLGVLGGKARATNSMTQQEPTITSVTPVIRRKIPISLSVVSYIFFTVGLIAVIRGFAASVVTNTDFPLLPLVSLALGVLYLFLSRGLRRCSRGWRICALVVTSFGLMVTGYRAAHYFLSHAANTTGTLPYGFLLALIFVLSVQAWILRVLTRADIHRLFYGSHDRAI